MKYLIPLVILCVLQSCAKNSEEDLIVDNPTVIDSTQTPVGTLKSFSNDIRPILDQYCISCHSNNNPSGSVSLETYNKVKINVVALNSESSLLYGVISHTFGYAMPPGGSKIPQNNIETIKNWIDEGALDN